MIGIPHVDGDCPVCGNPTLIKNTRDMLGGLPVPDLPEGIVACTFDECPVVHQPIGTFDLDLIAAIQQTMQAYRERWVAPQPGSGADNPVVYYAPGWQITAALADLAVEGRPATRDELDRFATEFLGYYVVVRQLDEILER